MVSGRKIWPFRTLVPGPSYQSDWPAWHAALEGWTSSPATREPHGPDGLPANQQRPAYQVWRRLSSPKGGGWWAIPGNPSEALSSRDPREHQTVKSRGTGGRNRALPVPPPKSTAQRPATADSQPRVLVPPRQSRSSIDIDIGDPELKVVGNGMMQREVSTTIGGPTTEPPAEPCLRAVFYSQT